MAEVSEYIKEQKGNEALIEYLRKFGKLSKEKADKLKEKIISLNNPKIKEDHVIKLIDFLPKDQEDANKVLLDTSLNEEEAQAVLEAIKSN